MLYIILIILLILFYSKNKELLEENNRLKKLLSGDNANVIKEKSAVVIQKNPNFIQVDNNLKTFEEKTMSQETKNNLILISGSILIILSAIVFLTSTWTVTHDFFKTIIIVLMLGVFLAVSHIADKFLNLKQTSKAFYYIALAYIPILFLSIALFELFGKYFSLYGLGKYIYLTFSCFLVSVIYYYNAVKNKNHIIAIFSVIFQTLGITFFALVFTNDINIILSVLLAYNLLLGFSYNYNKIYYANDFHLKTINILMISLGTITLYTLFINFIIGLTFTDVILQIILFISCYYILLKINQKEQIYNYVYPILIVSICYSLATAMGCAIVIKQMSILVAFLITYVYEYIKYNKIKIVTFVEILILFSILYLLTFIQIDLKGLIGINCYAILGIFLILNLLNYIITVQYRKLQAYILTITFVLTLFHSFSHLMLNNISIILSFIGLLLIAISFIKSKLEINFKKAFSDVGHFIILILFIPCVLTDEKIALLVLYSGYTVLSYLDGRKRKEESVKIISYVSFNVALAYLFELLNLEIAYVIPFSTLAITTFEYLNPRLKTNGIYIIVQFVISFLILLDYSITNFILMILMIVVFIIYINNNKSEKCLYIPALCLISYIYNSSILTINYFNYMYFVSLALILLIAILIYNNPKKIFIILFYLYTFCHIISLEEIKYVGLGLLLFGTLAIYKNKKEKEKDIFKFILYGLSFILFRFIVNDLGLNELTFLTTGSYLVLLLLITRTIIKKYGDSYKTFEYMFGYLINFIALFKYTSEIDGIIYVGFLTILVIFSYSYRFGSILLVCLISILLNVFILTRTFWFSIPWWVYILLFGSILVTFAVYNEMKEKNNIKGKVEKIKDKLDL